MASTHTPPEPPLPPPPPLCTEPPPGPAPPWALVPPCASPPAPWLLVAASPPPLAVAPAPPPPSSSFEWSSGKKMWQPVGSAARAANIAAATSQPGLRLFQGCHLARIESSPSKSHLGRG